MLDGVKRKGLMNRMIQNLGLQGNPMAVLVIYPIASACYPNAIKRKEDGILEPRISVERICSLTERFVDYGSGSIDDLYQQIWGVDGFDGYLEEFGEASVD
mgnify:CR=1 FL=1|jgi:hypothetical protein